MQQAQYVRGFILLSRCIKWLANGFPAVGRGAWGYGGERKQTWIWTRRGPSCQLYGTVLLLQATPAVLAGVSSKITWLGEAALALPAAGGIAGSPEEGFGWAVWAHSGTINNVLKVFVLFVAVGGRGGRRVEGETNEISQAWIQFRLPLKWLLMSWRNKVYLCECCMQKRSGVYQQRLDKPHAALPDTPPISREDSRMKLSLGDRNHSIWHFKIGVTSRCLVQSCLPASS